MSDLINTPEEFAATIGKPYDNEGNPFWWMCDDTGVLCWHCVNEDKDLISEAITSDCPDDMQWRVIGYHAWEGGDDPHICDNCGRVIVSGYAEQEAPEEDEKGLTLEDARRIYRVVPMHAPSLDHRMAPMFQVAANDRCPTLTRVDGHCYECPKAKGVDLSESEGVITSYGTYDGFCNSNTELDRFAVVVTGTNLETRTMGRDLDAVEAMDMFNGYRWGEDSFKRIEIIRPDGMVRHEWNAND